jgi:DNA-binding NtrC family response regulator
MKSGTAEAHTARSDPSKTRRVLIVDDEPTIQLTLSYALRGAGYEVVTASRLESAEAALERYPFDVVIADIRMSGILGVEGLELLTYIKRRWPHTTVIIMTAYGSEELRKDAFARGAAYYYDKPIDITDLTNRLKEMAA